MAAALDGPRLEAALRRAAGIIVESPETPGAPIFEASSGGDDGPAGLPLPSTGDLLDPTNILME